MAAVEPVAIDGRGIPARSRFQPVRGLGLPMWVAVGALGLITLIAVFAPVLEPHDPRLAAGPAFHPPSWTFPFGTDAAGRDMFSRVIAGVQSTWLSALGVITVGLLVGGAIGLVAGAAGGWLDGLLMRTTDLFLALPAAVLAIAVVAALGPSLLNTLIAVSILWWPYYARVIRVEVRSLAARPHLEAAKLAGTSRRRRLLRHLLPGAIPVSIVAASLDIANAIIILATLSFLGLGAQPPAPELGSMTASGASDLLNAWWLAIIPGIAIFVLCMVGNLAGDVIRDKVDR
jgi:peptide/nickel transport system permease protein